MQSFHKHHNTKTTLPCIWAVPIGFGTTPEEAIRSLHVNIIYYYGGRLVLFVGSQSLLVYQMPMVESGKECTCANPRLSNYVGYYDYYLYIHKIT